MHDASLYGYFRRHCLCTLFQTAYTIHGEEDHVFHTSCFGLVKDLHPLVLALCFAQPQSKDILDFRSTSPT